MGLDFVMRDCISAGDVSDTAHLPAPIPAQMLVTFFEVNRNNASCTAMPLF